ncbi:MAG: hypothetical protein K5855_03645, partial [Oscillospiraceae bacterium]|nr:hypothetical protein [Oscillospiraceae bacterium]
MSSDDVNDFISRQQRLFSGSHQYVFQLFEEKILRILSGIPEIDHLQQLVVVYAQQQLAVLLQTAVCGELSVSGKAFREISTAIGEGSRTSAARERIFSAPFALFSLQGDSLAASKRTKITRKSLALGC